MERLQLKNKVMRQLPVPVQFRRAVGIAKGQTTLRRFNRNDS